jgi:regulator of replication initiation timing
VLPLWLALSGPVARGGDEEEIQGLRERIAVLATEARTLQAEGKAEAAATLRERVRELEETLARREEERRAQRRAGQEGVESAAVREAVRFGLEFLRALGGEEASDDLVRLADEIERRFGERLSRAEREREDPAHGQRQLDAMRTALRALAEAGRAEAADLVERAMHALELLRTGRMGAEAREALRRAPTHEQVREALEVALDLLKEQGKQDLAEGVRWLVDELAAMHPPPPEPPGEARVADDPARERVAALERRLEELRRAVEDLRAQLAEMRDSLERR